jgi:hypothetical protein
VNTQSPADLTTQHVTRWNWNVTSAGAEDQAGDGRVLAKVSGAHGQPVLPTLAAATLSILGNMSESACVLCHTQQVHLLTQATRTEISPLLQLV